MSEIVMPRLSDSMEEGTILTWLKGVGDEVAVGEEIVEIETDKANMAYEADVAGTLSEILVGEGETVAIGTPIARIGDGADGGSDSAEGSERSPAGPLAAGDPPPLPVAEASSGAVPPTAPPAEEGSESAETPAVEVAGPTEEESAGQRPKASPLARRLAKEKQLDLAKLQGSGPGGRIVKADVEGASSAGDVGDGGVEDAPARSVPPSATAGPAAETAKGETSYEEPDKLQQVVARRMAESKATAPHFYLEAEVDMSACVAGRKKLKAAAVEGSVTPSFNDMVVKACALALREFPKANGAYRDGRFELYSRVNVGVAVAAPGALVVPTIFDADRKGLGRIAAETRGLAAKVRDGKVTPPELAGGTFTVSNLGMYGIANFSAVVNGGQAGILAVGEIAEKPVVRDGEITTARLMGVTLSCDHRILYGAEGAEFLARVRTLLEEPLSLAL